MIKRRDYERSASNDTSHIIRNTRNLSVAVEKGHARFAHQLVDELIALRDAEHIKSLVRHGETE